jgi:hypothetical protein
MMCGWAVIMRRESTVTATIHAFSIDSFRMATIRPPTGNLPEPLPISDDEKEEAPSRYIPEVAGDEYDYVLLKERRKVSNSIVVKRNATRRKNGSEWEERFEWCMYRTRSPNHVILGTLRVVATLANTLQGIYTLP